MCWSQRNGNVWMSFFDMLYIFSRSRVSIIGGERNRVEKCCKWLIVELACSFFTLVVLVCGDVDMGCSGPKHVYLRLRNLWPEDMVVDLDQILVVPYSAHCLGLCFGSTVLGRIHHAVSGLKRYTRCRQNPSKSTCQTSLESKYLLGRSRWLASIRSTAASLPGHRSTPPCRNARYTMR